MNRPVRRPPNTTNKEAKSKKGIISQVGRLLVSGITPTVSRAPIIKTAKQIKKPSKVVAENFMKFYNL
jgi:hypothetical protein